MAEMTRRQGPLAFGALPMGLGLSTGGASVHDFQFESPLFLYYVCPLMIQGIFTFVKAAFKNPMQVSTVFPSSGSLSNSMLDNVDISKCTSVVEIGVGTGAITKHIAKRMAPTASYIGVEVNEEMTRYMQKQFPRSKYPNMEFRTASAETLSSFIGEGSVDAVVSSLPWSLFPDSLQQGIVDEVQKILAPNGLFVTFMYPNATFYPRAKRAIKRFADSFSGFERKELVVQNIPPAFVFVGGKKS